MEITLKLHKEFATQEFKNNFTKKEIVMLDDSSEEYPQYITFQLIKENCEKFEKQLYGEGTELKLFFNLNGREWTNPEGQTKYFNSLVVWKWEEVNVVRNEIPADEVLNPVSQQEVLNLKKKEVPPPPLNDDMPF